MQFGFSVVKLCDMLHDCETETGSAKRPTAFFMNPVKAFKDTGLALLRNPTSVIRYGNDRVILIA